MPGWLMLKLIRAIHGVICTVTPRDNLGKHPKCSRTKTQRSRQLILRYS
jgi:hypothetical protein